jgi:hypothetical protein
MFMVERLYVVDVVCVYMNFFYLYHGSGGEMCALEPYVSDWTTSRPFRYY